ncbi:tetratricopeptide repeat protein [Pedobacter changchengzhani]|uniref:Tetratricopeptide repeat protein n=1 Tax=Pedobacter changchengzhani TaxID=2529274 RepID=A0A4R5MMB9_9SPHI|nr:tetratricopeptide repeat protein [Pedobacter changchengzhani]TDG36937.1 tetratricopeptide repeat protein [Pedobacter changchengzhani]
MKTDLKFLSFLLNLKTQLLFFILFLFSFSLTAQTAKSPVKTVKKDFNFKVNYVYQANADTVILLFYNGGKWGVKKGDQGKIFGTHSTNEPNRSQKELGYCTVINVIGDTVGVLAKIYPQATSADMVRVGDYATLSITVPDKNYYSLFYDLALLQINFLDGFKKPMYDVNYLLQKDSKTLTDSLLNASIIGIKDIYEMVKEDTSYKSLRVKLVNGRYAGRSPLDVMEKVNKDDIMSFLKFVRSYPGKYIGNDWKMAEVFATWVINDAPLNAEEALDYLVLNEKFPLKQKAFLEQNRKLIIKDEFLRNWVQKGYQANNVGNDVLANQILALTEKAGTILNDTSGLAFYNYIRAQIIQDKEQYTQAIPYADKAINLFQSTNNYEFYFETKLKRFYLERMALNFVAIEKTRNELKSDFERYKSNLDKDLYQLLKGRYLSYYGHALKKKGDLNEAKVAYQQASQEFAVLKDLNGAEETAATQENIADIETIQNNYAAALPVYDSLAVAYGKLTQYVKKANMLNNKAFALNKMGSFDKSIEVSKEALKIQVKNEDWNNAGYSLSIIGQNLWSLGKFEEAIKSHKLSITYRKDGDNPAGAGYSYTKLGDLYTETGDKLKAIAAYDSAMVFYTKISAKDEIAQIQGSLGKIYLSDNNPTKAITYFLGAYEALKSLGLKQEMAAQLYNVADASYKDQPILSAQYYKQAFDLYKEIGIKDQMLYCLLNLGNIETRSKNFEKAEDFFQQAFVISKEINGKREQAVVYNKLADAASIKLNLPDALVKYDQALTIYKELEEKAEQATVHLAMGYVYISQGKFDDAEKTFNSALDIATSTNNAKAKADAFLSLSDLHQLKGEFDLSKKAIDSCFKIYRKLGNIYQVANTHIVAGNYYNHLSDNIKAIENYKIADSIFVAEKEINTRFTTLNNIGTIYFYQGDYNQALIYFNQASKILEKQSVITEEKLLILSNIGEVYYHQKNYAEAEKYLLQSLEYAEKLNAVRSIAMTSLIVGKLYYDKGDYPKSSTNLLYAYNYAKSSKENTQLSESSLYLGKLALAQKNEVDATKYFNETITNSDRVGDVKYAWEALYQRGLIFYNKEQLDSAEKYFKFAIKRVEKSALNIYGGEAAKKIFSSDEKKVNLYSTLIATLIKLGKTDEALEFTSRSNTEAIKEKLQQVGTSTSNAKKASVLDQQKQLAQKVNSVEDNLNKEQAKPINEQSKEKIITLQKVQKFAQAQLLNFLDSMVNVYPDLKDNFVKNVNPEDLKNYKSKIPPDVAVLLYVVRENQLIIFTLTKETTKAKLINISGAELSAHVKDFTAVLKYPFKDKNAKPLKLRGVDLNNYVESANSLAETGTDLYKILIAPIKDEIADKTKLCIINNGELSSIPFQTIGTKDNNGVFRYLVEDYSIFYTNRLDVFNNVDPGLIKGLSFVAYGNPDKTLPSAEREVNEIQKIIPTAKVYVGDVATEDKAKKSLVDSKIVHFATHGILDYSDFSKTFLKFAASPGSDGKLTIQDIKGLDIENCDLVTLSACETAVSQDVTKGWFVSPANSLLVNGVKTVVASLWSVDDEATSLLMSSFYGNLKTMHKAEALRKAQETLSQNPKYTHPFYWGAFILYGEWR